MEEISQFRRLIEFMVVAFIAWVASDYFQNALKESGVEPSIATWTGLGAFLIAMLIFYRLIILKVNVDV